MTSANSVAFAFNAAGKLGHRRQENLVRRCRRRNVDGRRKNIVARLPAVHMIVGMRAGQMADHLVGVHVGGGAAAGLENVDDELIVVIAASYGVSRFCDGCGQVRGQLSKLAVDSRGGAFDQSERSNEGSGKTQSADWEILDRALRLGAVRRPGRDVHFAHRVALDAIVHEPRGLLSACRWYRIPARCRTCRASASVSPHRRRRRSADHPARCTCLRRAALARPSRS